MSLWFSSDAARFFIVPHDTLLPKGEMLVQSMDGETLYADAAALSRYEVSRDVARWHFEDTHENAIADELVQQIASVLNVPYDAKRAEAAHTIFNPPSERVAPDPAAFIDELEGMLVAFAELLEGAISIQPQRRAVAEQHLRAIRQSAQARGIALDEAFDQLPDLLQRLYTRERKGQVLTYAAKLRETAKLLRVPQEQVDLDEVVRKMEKHLSQLFGWGMDQKISRAQQHSEYRQHADDAIARSLRAHGFDTNRPEDF